MSFDDHPEDGLAPDAKRRKWLTACAGKQQFDTPALANAVSRRRSKKGRAGKVYKCKGCGKYHIGSPKWEPRRIK